MKCENKHNKISVRLSDKANKKLIEAESRGYTKSEFVNNAIIGCNTANICELRTAMACVCNIQTELELITDATAQNKIRKELSILCRALKSSLSPM